MTALARLRRALSRPAPDWPALVAAARREAGLTQAALAARLGLDRVAVARWECGTARPTAQHLAAVVAALGDGG